MTEKRDEIKMVVIGTEFTDATFLFSEAILRTPDRATAIRVPLNRMSMGFKQKG
jgi:hypothetical protein